jgi:hypothetical protein
MPANIGGSGSVTGHGCHHRLLEEGAMTGRRLMLTMLLTILACGSPAWAGSPVGPTTIEITPAHPTPDDTIVATVSGEWSDTCTPQNPDVSRIKQAISIDTSTPAGFCGLAITPWHLDVSLGQLPAGEYTVTVRNFPPIGLPKELASTTFVVGICGDASGPGGTDVPCRCGNVVTTNTKLNGSDPVLKTPCPCNGLIVASGVTLDIGGTILAATDPNACTETFPSGIVLGPGATNVTITTGRIVGFEIGVRSDFDTGVTHGRFERLQILESVSFGFLLDGDDNTICSNVVRRTDQKAGIQVSGDRNVVCLNRAEYGSAFGMIVEGEDNTISRNVALENDFDGFTICGGGNTVEQNRSDYNGRFGIVESCDGPPPNIYRGNRCTGNGAGPSDPPGLCR